MKKVLSLILFAAFVCQAFCGIVSAETAVFPRESTEMRTGGFVPDTQIPVRTATAKSALRGTRSVPTIYEHLESGMRNHDSEIVIYPTYKVQISDFRRILRTVLFENYDIFVYDDITDDENYFRGTKASGTNYVYSFEPFYFTPEEGEEEAVAMMDREIDKYLAAVSEIPDYEVVGKLAVIYDLFCKNNVYATEEYEEEKATGIVNNDIRTAYDLFKKNRAVCQGNAIALDAIYDKLNEQLMEGKTGDNIIETSFCSSNAIEHLWNVLKVDGKWYHLDETWDDAEYQISEEETWNSCYHDYFLMPTSAMDTHFSNGTNDWVYYAEEAVDCYDDKYMKGYIFNGNYITECMQGKARITADCGTYYGTISYEDGRYKIEILSRCVYSPQDGMVYVQPMTDFRVPFWSETVTSSGLIATDSYVATKKNGEQYLRVDLFSNFAIEKNIYGYYVRYGESGLEYLKDNKILDELGAGEFRYLPYSMANAGGRALFWDSGFEPFCRAVDIQ